MESVQWLCGNSYFFLAWLFLLLSWETLLAVLLPCWKCCLLFVALITSQTFFFSLVMETHKAAKIHIVYCAWWFHGPKLSSTGVILNISVRDGEIILACTLASDSPVSPGCDAYLMGSTSNLAWRCSSFLRGTDVSAIKCCWPYFRGVARQKCDALGAVPRTLSVERCFCGVAHTDEHQLVQGGCKAYVAISSHLPLFWKLYYEPETENCPQINWILKINW